MDWNIKAAQVAAAVGEMLPGVHRGVLLPGDFDTAAAENFGAFEGVAVFFENRGDDAHARMVVDLLEQSLEDFAIDVLGRGQAPEWGTVALLARVDLSDYRVGLGLLHDWLWDAARITFGDGGAVCDFQYQHAMGECLDAVDGDLGARLKGIIGQ